MTKSQQNLCGIYDEADLLNPTPMEWNIKYVNLLCYRIN